MIKQIYRNIHAIIGYLGNKLKDEDGGYLAELVEVSVKEKKPLNR